MFLKQFDTLHGKKWQMNTLNLTSILNATRHALYCLLALVLLQTAVMAADADATNTVMEGIRDIAPLPTTADGRVIAGASSESSSTSFLRGLIPVFAIVFGIIGGVSIPIVALWTDYKKRRNLIDSYHKERLMALEKGMEAPAYPNHILGLMEPPNGEEKKLRPALVLKSGLVWLFFGIGFTVFLYFQPRVFIHYSFGSIFIAVGLAKLIYYAIEKDKKESQ